MMKNGEKGSSLLVQVSAITISIFLVILVVVLITNRYRTQEVYLTSKNEMIDYELNRIVSNMTQFQVVKWCIDFMENNDEDVTSPEANKRLTEELYPDENFFHMLISGITDDEKGPKDAPLEYQVGFATHIYGYFKEFFSYDVEDRGFADIYFIDIIDEHNSFLFASGADKGGENADGTVISYEASEHKAVREILDGKLNSPGQTLYEVYYDPDENRYYYIGYTPLVIGGQTVGYVCFKYDWTSFHHDINRRIILAAIGAVLILIVLEIILMLFLYKTAIANILKVKDGMLVYMKDKDSSAVIKKLKEIRIHNEVGVLSESFTSLTVEIDRYVDEIEQLSSEKERFATELSLANKIQADSLPGFPAFPERNDFKIFALMEPAKGVGGDFYDFFMIGDDQLAIVVADVSGKGIPAALFMMTSMTMIKTRALNDADPAMTLHDVNNLLAKNNDEGMFVTVWLGVLELTTGKLTYSDAGHEKLLVRRDGKWEMLPKENNCLPLAVLGEESLADLPEDMQYSNMYVQLRPGDMIFQYTDGVTEAFNPEDELFGEERLTEALRNTDADEPEEVLRFVREQIAEFVKDKPQSDDITMLGMIYRGNN